MDRSHRMMVLAAALAAAAATAQQQEPPKAPATAAAPAKATPATPKGFQIWHPRRPAKEEDYQVARWGPRGLPSPGYAFRAAKVIPITSEPIVDGIVVTKNGRIEAIGPAKSTPRIVSTMNVVTPAIVPCTTAPAT